jgi:hypothetical protein
MGQSERDEELQLHLEHGCAWSKQYAYLSTRRDRLERQLEACDASKRKMSQLCPRFETSAGGILGYCKIHAIEGEKQICTQQCGRSSARIMNGRLRV